MIWCGEVGDVEADLSVSNASVLSAERNRIICRYSKKGAPELGWSAGSSSRGPPYPYSDLSQLCWPGDKAVGEAISRWR
ncbi:hypothetical protein Tco_1217417 [Tanacetum coccineum]